MLKTRKKVLANGLRILCLRYILSKQVLIAYAILLYLHCYTLRASEINLKWEKLLFMDVFLPTCCKEEMLTDKEPLIKITSCYILPSKCISPFHLYRFVDQNNWLHCIDPKAPWLSKRKTRLRKVRVYRL
uniref:Chemokine interleukin-8-like domain-containing protein n=1 Tax=Sinocyclocheilus grahami TaxID=75366 RepID=A0A672RL01_SINGR